MKESDYPLCSYFTGLRVWLPSWCSLLINYSFHGHTHNFAIKSPYRNVTGGKTRVKYVTTEAANDRGYLVITIEKDDIKIEKINL